MPLITINFDGYAWLNASWNGNPKTIKNTCSSELTSYYMVFLLINVMVNRLQCNMGTHRPHRPKKCRSRSSYRGWRMQFPASNEAAALENL
jgi:hypothetical protein